METDREPSDLFVMRRSAVLRIMAFVVAVVAWWLAWLATGWVPEAVLAGGAAFGRAVAFFDRYVDNSKSGVPVQQREVCPGLRASQRRQQG
jgi:hypothetical protein